jgi:hypothetical protein
MLDVTTLRDRVVELRRLRPSELDDHPYQWKTHPANQRGALTGMLQEIGIAGVLLAWPSARNGGRLTAIDGHLRKELADVPWPTIITDLTDAEADYLLLTHDWVATLAQGARDQLEALIPRVTPRSEDVALMIADLAKAHGLGAEPPSLEQLEGTYGAPQPSDFWPVIRVQVSPEVHARYRALLDQLDGADEGEKFGVLVNLAEAAQADA